MTGALIKINSLSKDLSRAEQQVASYILKNPKKVPFLSVSELAKETDVSVASVSRLSKKIGYRSFQEFKMVIAQENPASIRSIYTGIEPTDSDEEIVGKVFGGNIKSLEDTLKILDVSDLVHAANIISTARRVIFVGMSGSGTIARDAAIRFSSLGLIADAYIESFQMLTQCLNLGSRDVALGISHSGRSKITVEALKLAHEKGATVIGLSNYMKSPLSKISDIFFCTSFPEKGVKAAAISSVIDQICLIDCLYILVARRKKDLSNTEIMDKVTEAFLRIE